jgi:glycine cleavage system aminomethyltransferase T
MPSVQDGIDKAGSAVRLLWKPDAEPWYPEAIEPEYAGWKTEQHAWHESVTIADLSQHMSDTFIEGPDATRLLAQVSANNYESFAVDQAKQFVPVADDGNIITDGILLKVAEQRYVLSGVPAAQNWVAYHAESGGHDVSISTNRETSARHDGSDPALFRYQIQGPLALELVQSAFGGPIPETRFFHSTPVSLAGRRLRALRHGMAGQAGYEFIGAWADAPAVKDALMSAGEPLGLVHQGAMSYPTASMDSGWIPSPTPAIYTDPGLAAYRKWVPLYDSPDPTVGHPARPGRAGR